MPLRDPLVAQWLRRCAPSAGGLGSIPGPGTRPHMLQLKYPLSSQINNNNKKLKKKKNAIEKKINFKRGCFLLLVLFSVSFSILPNFSQLNCCTFQNYE